MSPITFEKVNTNRFNPVLSATPSQIKRAQRISVQAERVPKFDPYALFLEVTVSEMEPPLENLDNLYKFSLDKVETAKKVYSTQ